MAKKEEKAPKAPRKVDESGDPAQGDVDRVLRDLKNKFNKDKGDGDAIAWNLAIDGDNPTECKEFISTGSTLLDYTISNRRNGGVPVGKITEIAGEESSGKSLICAHLAANVQKQGGFVVYIDTENAYNPDFAQRIGVDNRRVLYMQPGTIENCFEALEQSILSIRGKNTKAMFLIIWDSIAATPCQAEIEGDYDPNSRIGLMAKAMAKGMRKLTDVLGKDRVALVFTNHLKVKIGVMYGDPWTTPGGKAVPYHASVRIRLTSSTKLKDLKTGQVYAIQTSGKAYKTRLGPPHRSCKFQIQFATGIDDIGSWRDALHEVKEISKANGFMIMNNVPGPDVIDEKTGEVTAPVVGELKFRESAWRELVETRSHFRGHILDLLEKHFVVKYDKATPVDHEGEVEVESFEGEE